MIIVFQILEQMHLLVAWHPQVPQGQMLSGEKIFPDFLVSHRDATCRMSADKCNLKLLRVLCATQLVGL